MRIIQADARGSPRSYFRMIHRGEHADHQPGLQDVIVCSALCSRAVP